MADWAKRVKEESSVRRRTLSDPPEILERSFQKIEGSLSSNHVESFSNSSPHSFSPQGEESELFPLLGERGG
jgi:hypothetical protein